MDNQVELVATGLKFPEGPAYDGGGAIYCSNCDADYITKVDADGQISVSHRAAAEGYNRFTFRKTNGMTFFRDGSLFACDFGRNSIIRIHPDGTQTSYVDHYAGRPLEAPNDLAFDPQGNLYFTAPGGSGRDNSTGPIYRVDNADHQITRVAEGMAFPNGLAFTSDARRLYVCESQFDRILRFSVADDGSLHDVEVFADLLADGSGEPDGMAVDSAGRLWIAHYGRHTVLIVNTEGKIERTIKLPVDASTASGGPTNVVFAGKDLRAVYITDPGNGALYRTVSDVPGLPLFCAPDNVG